MIWQDIVILIAQCAMLVAIIPTVRDRASWPRRSTVIVTGFSLLGMAFALQALGAIASSVITVFLGSLWLAMSIRGAEHMAQPNNKEEYLTRYHSNQRYTGFGLETAMVMPCPFCAAPDFLVCRVIDTEKALSEDTKCKECERSAKYIFQRNAIGVTFEIVQTGGPDQPDWFTPKMRRI